MNASQQSAHHALYNTRRWRLMREDQLRREPLCALCRFDGRVTAATIADHVKPHNGDVTLFFDRRNLQSCCQPCHDGRKRISERRGFLIGCDVGGMPVDPQHHWNRGAQ